MLIHACLDAQLYTVVHGALGGHNLTLPLARPRLRWRCSQRAAQLLPIFGNPLSVGDSSRCDPAGTPSDAGGWGRAPASEIDACAKTSRCNRYEPTINASGVTVRRARAHTHTRARARTHGRDSKGEHLVGYY